MKKRFISTMLVVALFFSISSMPVYSSNKYPMVVTTEYFFIASSYDCISTIEIEGRDKFKISMVLGSIDSATVTVSLTKNKFMFDNMNNPTAVILLHDLWDAIAHNLFEVYEKVYGEEMPGRTIEGISRELRMHEWIMRNAIVINSFFYDVDNFLDSSTVTDLGCIDIGDLSDTNAFVFEQAQTDLHAILLYMSEVMNSRVAKVISLFYKIVDVRVWKFVDGFLKNV